MNLTLSEKVSQGCIVGSEELSNNYSVAELKEMCSNWHKYTLEELVVTKFRTSEIYLVVCILHILNLQQNSIKALKLR